MELCRKHIFYHADRAALLKEGQEIILGKDNLSYFGRTYWSAIQNKSVEEMDASERREFYLEKIRNDPAYLLYGSRLQSIFAAISIEDAIMYANTITPKPSHPIPIFEIYAQRFWTLDMNWLDFITETPQQNNYWSYWDGGISNHCPQDGERLAPKLEIMIALPACAFEVMPINRNFM